MQKMFGKVLLSVALLAFSILAVIIPARASTDPALILMPDEGSLGTSVTAYGYGFPASDDTTYNVTIWWESIDYCDGQDEPLTWVSTGADGRFEAHFEVPHTYGGPHNVTAVTDGAEPTSATAVFTVTPSLWVDPATGYNEGTVMNVYGAGLDSSEEPYLWYIDNVLFAGKDEGFDPDCRGDIHFQFVCAGFCCSGLHSVFAIKGYTYEIEADATFTVVREEETPLEDIDAIKTEVETIREEVIIIKADTATIRTDVENITGRTKSIEGDIGRIETDLGTVKVHISDLKTDMGAIREGIVGIEGDIATIVEVEGDMATVKTDLGTIKVDISDLRETASRVISAASDAEAAAKAARLEASGVWFLSLMAAIASALTLIITVIIIFLE